MTKETSKYFPPQTPKAGSSPALRIACPVCKVAAGSYCMKYENHPTRGLQSRTQTIAHKRRREEEERTR